MAAQVTPCGRGRLGRGDDGLTQELTGFDDIPGPFVIARGDVTARAARLRIDERDKVGLVTPDRKAADLHGPGVVRPARFHLNDRLLVVDTEVVLETGDLRKRMGVAPEQVLDRVLAGE
jgi:hypothetical protein